MVKSLRENPRVRRIAIPTYRGLTRALVFRQGPRVLVNSIHKSGTHLLTTLLHRLPGVVQSGRHYVLDDFKTTPRRPDVWGETPDVDWERLQTAFARLNRGQFVTSHFQSDQRLTSILHELDYRVLLILRDPRDVVVSSAFYMSRLQRHVMHSRYTVDFTSDPERIMATITGFEPNENGLGSISVGQRLDSYLGWLSDDRVLSCRFEDLIGPAGGGEASTQLALVGDVAKHLGYTFSTERIEAIASSVWSERSPTFRKGAIGDWRNHFTPEHISAFKEIAGRQLITLGYERDLEW
jgi:hypothetical protein